MDESPNLTLTRRRQRRPDLQTECQLPTHLAKCVADVEAELNRSMNVQDGKSAEVLKAMRATCDALQTLRTTARTPELQLRAVSKVTSSVRECRLGHPENKGERDSLTASEAAFMDSLIVRFVFPLLLDCRVRYLHKALTTLFRTTYVITPETLDAFEATFLNSLQQWCEPSHLTATTTTTAASTHRSEAHLFVRPTNDNGAASLTASLKESKERVMYFLNSLDGLSSTLMPMMPSVFFRTFLTVLPLLGECLHWAVEQALASSCVNHQGNDIPHGSAGSLTPTITTTTTTTTVFGEDLEHVRFCARVVATYMHKYMGRLTTVLQSPSSAEEEEAAADMAHIQRDLANLLLPTALMFRSEAFPKDVLNAAGLLLASILTVRTCDRDMLVVVCRAVCEEKEGEEEEATATNSAKATHPNVLVDKAAAELCAVNVTRGFPALAELCAQMTKNARFAVLKGLLAHLSAPIHESMVSLSVFLLPFTASDRTATTAPTTRVPLYDVILPYAERYANTLSEPETRFMAIQCMDSIVRHLVAVLSTCQQSLTSTSDDDAHNATATPAKRARKEAPHTKKQQQPSQPRGLKVSETNTAVLGELLPSCLPSPAMLHALRVVTQLAMGLWDDGTQQMSGTLYGTYDEVLRAQALTAWFQHTLSASPASGLELPSSSSDRAALTSLAVAAAPLANSLDPAHALRDVLSIQNERRGKYHALLGLMGTLPCDVFLNAVTEYYGELGLESFAMMLLSGATNHKIGNVCGEVFCKTVALVLQHQQQQQHEGTPSSSAGVFESALVQPLAKAIVVDGYVTVASNVDTATAISNTVAHFVTPLLRQEAKLLPVLLDALKTASQPTMGPRAVQGVVETISRARSVGLDVAAYLTPGHETFEMLQRTTQVMPFELRNAALNLLVLSPKKAEPVLAWQCALVEAFVSLNLQLGGDNTARKMLFESLRKWTRRVGDTFGPATAPATDYQTTLLTHCSRLSNVLAAHIGTPEAPLAVERRVAAMCVYKMLLVTALTILSAEEKSANSATLTRFFVPSAVPMLVTDLSDGWEQTRLLARELLELFAVYTPASVFETCELARRVLVEGEAYADVVRARTYRNAEGAVQRFALSAFRCPAAVQQLHAHPGDFCDRVRARLTEETAAIDGACQRMESLTGQAALEFVVATPLHGRLSLCTELVSTLLTSSPTTSTGVAEVCDAALRVAMRVLTACGGLVGADADGDGGEVVDCRGHVFTKGDPGAEAVMRRVVNNTWLSVRVATALITRVLSGVKVEQLDFAAVRGACFALVHVLLCTKHNGVMRCARGALKAALEILIRSRGAALHGVPREMLEHLLGDDGVTSTDVSRMLRRSQGLPHAILAVLEAEDSNMPYVLFPFAMACLMRVAKAMHVGDGEASAPPPPSSSRHQALPELALSQCSNALNVLKFVFEDRTLSDRAVAYLEEAFTIATSGFNHTSWYIRNSCLMLFASVLQRLIGEHPSLGGAGVNTSLHDLQRRAPDAVVFALETLHTARHMETLALFPILQMLSMLSPDPPELWKASTTNDAPTSGTATTDVVAAMVNAVAECGSSASLMVRAASAVALACVVPVDAIRTVMMRVAEGFQATTTTTTAATSNHHRHSRGYSLNALHGTILQLHQFHRQYVGTTHHTSRRRLLSGYATRDVRQIVSTTAAQCLVQFDTHTLQRVSQCPTTAAALFSLLSDVLAFASQNDMPLETEAALIELAEPILTASFAHSPPVALLDVTDRVAVRAHAAAVLMATIVSVTRQAHPCVLPSASSVMALWGRILGAEQRNLLCTRNVDQHQDLVTSLLDAYLGATVARPDLATFVSALAQLTGFDVCEANTRALERAVTTSFSSSSSPADTEEHWLGCLTSSVFSTHTRFALLLAESSGSLGSRVRHDPAFLGVVQSFRGLFSARIASATVNNGGDQRSLHDAMALETEAPGMQLVTVCATASGSDCGVDAAVIRLLTFYSDPDQAEVLRRNAVDCLGMCMRATASSPTPVALDIKAALFFVLLRLLCDDASAIREAACRVCSDAASDAVAGCRDQFTCVLSVVKALHQCCVQMGPTHNTMTHLCQQYLLQLPSGDSDHAVAAGDANEASGARDNENDSDDSDDEDEEEEEVLFEKEADNMFTERALMSFFASRILDGVSGGAREPGQVLPSFPVFDDLLEPSVVAKAEPNAVSLSLLSF